MNCSGDCANLNNLRYFHLMQPRQSLIILVIAFFSICCNPISKLPDGILSGKHRPQIHFSPKANWMNDPNGMVYFNGTYHLFFQYYPDSTVWGPMHWGHATSKDLIHWQEQDIALYPDSLGYIFSGSAVVDSNNTSGFGEEGRIPLVSIFTHHDPDAEKSGSDTFQVQSVAFSLDEGKTWTKYAGNPVLRNPGIRDFRDPKVMWHAASQKWIMALAAKDVIAFYSSPDLKSWQKESDFGKEIGAHGGVWECPDLFPINYQGEELWTLLVSINPGGPNGGSGTQYFIGKFDGHQFVPADTTVRWIDFGPDNYAGVTWSNTGERKIFIGWMSNWMYANKVPTDEWRSAMTVPRDLSIKEIAGKFFLASAPVPELDTLNEQSVQIRQEDEGTFDGPAVLKLSADTLESFSLVISNTAGEQVVAGYDKTGNRYFIDRSKSGKTNFDKGFGTVHYAPRSSANKNLDVTLILDDASIELFADEGTSVMTSIFFPNENFSAFQFQSADNIRLTTFQLTPLKSIW